jgi:lysophospholipase L1-like esterase
VYTAQLRAAVQTEGATYLDASGWIPDADLFADHLHLSKEGAKQFSRHMAEYLLAQSNR